MTATSVYIESSHLGIGGSLLVLERVVPSKSNMYEDKKEPRGEQKAQPQVEVSGPGVFEFQLESASTVPRRPHEFHP